MLPIGKVLKSDGTDGGILLGLSELGLEDIDLKEPVFIAFDGLEVPFFISSIRAKGSTKAVVKFFDVDTLADAEELVGRDVLLDCELESEEELDLSGWTVSNRGDVIGTVEHMELFPGNPCISVGGHLIPLHEDLITSLDDKKRKIDFNLPEGLLDD